MTAVLLSDRSTETDNTQILVYYDPTRTLYFDHGEQIRTGWSGYGWYRWDRITFRGVYIGRYLTKRRPGRGCRMEHHTDDDSGYGVLGHDWTWLLRRARERGVEFPLMRGDLVATKDGTFRGYISHKAKKNHLTYFIRVGDVEGPLESFAAHTLKLIMTRDELEVERARCQRY